MIWSIKNIDSELWLDIKRRLRIVQEHYKKIKLHWAFQIQTFNTFFDSLKDWWGIKQDWQEADIVYAWWKESTCMESGKEMYYIEFM